MEYTNEQLRAAREISGTVFDIERFSLHDGRGIRTVVFLKGCPLHCAWCANPESNRPGPQVGLFADKCAFCKKCAEVCPNGAVFLREHRVDWEHCTGCLKCVDVCLYDARVAYGKRMTAGEVFEAVKRDQVFYRNSGGGVTLSGGEMSAQPEFSAAILTLCRAAGIHTAVETTGFCKWERFEPIVRQVDQLLFDFKNMDSTLHKKYTGVGNELILENAAKAAPLVPEMVVRWPVIPGFNDSDENAAALAAYLKQNMPSVSRVDLLPYHSAGKSKCERIGTEYGYEPPYELSKERVAELQGLLLDNGLDARIGG